MTLQSTCNVCACVCACSRVLAEAYVRVRADIFLQKNRVKLNTSCHDYIVEFRSVCRVSVLSHTAAVLMFTMILKVVFILMSALCVCVFITQLY